MSGDGGAAPETVVLDFEVTAADTAVALGSGDVAVLATPRLLAWCEAVTCRAAAGRLDPGRTSVGTRVTLEHLLATPVGGRVAVEARLLAAEGRLLRYEVRAVDRHGAVVGAGEVTRVIVDRDRFAARTPAP